MIKPEVCFSAEYVNVLLKDLKKAEETYIKNEILLKENKKLRDIILMEKNDD